MRHYEDLLWFGLNGDLARETRLTNGGKTHRMGDSH